MEQDFDKEIDAILRQARLGRGVLVGDSPRQHLDADELAAFAENALPEKTKQLYTGHIADCDRCRKTLASVILLNSEAEPASASTIAAPVETTVPWYRTLFVFPNIAYVMGSLVLLFSGFFAFSVLQESPSSVSSDVSQIDDSEPSASGPNLGVGDSNFPSSANNAESMANAMNSAANSMANLAKSNANAASSPSNTSIASPAVTGRTLGSGGGELGDRDKQLTPDGLVSGGSKPASALAPAPTVRSNDETDDLVLDSAPKDHLAEKKEMRELAKRKTVGEDLPRIDSRGPAKSSGPSRDMQSQFPNRAENSAEIAATRAVGGKKFQRKDGVWYDTAYRGQATTNVRRGTDEYRRLDSGLRVIVEGLDGVIVTVWKSKAYRIQ